MNTPFIGSMHLSLPLLLLLGKATIILLAALGITLGMQRASAGARHLVWLVTLATLLLVPALTAWGPVRIGLLPSESDAARIADRGSRNSNEKAGVSAPLTPLPADIGTPASAARPLGLATLGTVSSILDPRSRSLDPRSISPLQLLIAIYALVVLAILASLTWSGLAVRRIVRHASPLEHESWRTPLYEVADRMGLDDAPRLMKSDDAKMPFACGIVTPTIVLPADCEQWTLERRRAVLLHELAHVRRHDLLGHTLGRLACAFYWFHPLVWTAAKQLRNESERACDDLALSCGTRATDYAEHLLEIVTSVRRDTTPSVALAMARRKEFEGRMLAILDPELRHSSPTRRQSAALIGSLALVALTVGAISPVARTADAAQTSSAPQAATRSTPAAARAAAPSAAASGYDADSRLLGPQRTAFRSDTGYTVDMHTNENISESMSQRVSQRVATRTTTAVGEAIGAFAGATASATVSAVVQALGGAAKKESLSATAEASRETHRLVQQTLREMNGPRSQSKDERATLLAKVLRSDTSASLRRVAAWGLHEYADEQVAAEALAGALRSDGDARVREMAAWALGEGSDRNNVATAALSAAVRSDADDQVRATSAWALGESGDRSAIPALVAALSQQGAAFRVRVLWAIGNIEPKDAPTEVMNALRDDDANVRKVAAWALYQIEDPAAAGPLQAALKSEPNKDVQLAEIRALGALGEKSVEALKALVESSDPRMRSMAVHALAGGHASGPWPWPWPQPRPFP
jgi:beta-lactamase regulating signal transducer with metallopeptidase domain/HEAT repeat protein